MVVNRKGSEIINMIPNIVINSPRYVVMNRSVNRISNTIVSRAMGVKMNRSVNSRVNRFVNIHRVKLRTILWWSTELLTEK